MVEIVKMADKSPDFKRVAQLYHAVFPKNERLPLAFLKMRAKAGGAEFCGIYDDQALVGFFYTIFDRRLAYVFFLAIDPRHHGNGFGSQALAAIKERYADRPVALSAERPNVRAANNHQRVRRHRFYASNGFRKAGFYTIEKGAEEFDFLVHGTKVKPPLFQSLLNRFLKKHRRYYVPYRIVHE